MIQRYRCHDTSIAGAMRPDDKGTYVRYADIEPLLPQWVACAEPPEGSQWKTVLMFQLPPIPEPTESFAYERAAHMVENGDDVIAVTKYVQEPTK